MQLITVKQELEALDEQIIPLIQEGMFLSWEIQVEDIEFYLIIRHNWNWELSQEFCVWLWWESEFFIDEHTVDDNCSREQLIEYIKEFRSNPHQFVETYGD